MKQYEYAKEHAGQTSVEYRVGRRTALLIGCSKIYEDVFFYYTEVKGEIDGPFYFNNNKGVKDLLSYPMKENVIAKEILPERKAAV